jgi:hypothetical protein
MSLRPASRDLSDDARSGNINPTLSVRDLFAHARQDLAILRSAGAPNDWRRAYALPINGQQQQCRKGKLPSYLQSLHHIRPARPSMVSSGLGSDVPSDLSIKQNTWKLPDISSLHNVCRTRINPKADAKLLFLQRISSTDRSQHQSELVELSGIEPLTPCLQSRCSPS